MIATPRSRSSVNPYEGELPSRSASFRKKGGILQRLLSAPSLASESRSTSKSRRSLFGGRRSFSASNAGTMMVSTESLPQSQTASAVSLTKADPNVIEWLQSHCPEDVLPLVLAFSGPQKMAALAKCNRFWRNVMQSEGTWRRICEELYKWTPGQQEPESWKDYYRLSPCVPTDYRSVHEALKIANSSHHVSPRRSSRKDSQRQTASVRILFRPGRYYLHETIHIQALEGVSISLETIQVPQNTFKPKTRLSPQYEHPEQPSSSKRNSTSIRRLMTCHRLEVLEQTEISESSTTEEWMDFMPPNQTHATLILRSRRVNEPVFHVQQGFLFLKDIEIQHNSMGLDIWNGNAAIQIQPPFGEDELPMQVTPRPTAILIGVEVTSRSGRGIVNIEGGELRMRNSAVHDCAATGVYIGGQGSRAVMEFCDIVRNGLGNLSRRGIARGHSGVYLEQGHARVMSCNVSNNTLTGISVVSPDNSVLEIQDSSLVANGSYQLELPPLNTNARRRSVVQNNTLSNTGRGQPRSGLVVVDHM